MIAFGVLTALIVIIIIVVSYNNRKKKEKEKLQQIENIANANNCKITQYEYCGDFIIGIDEPNRYVFFSKKKNENLISEFINLADIKNCKINNFGRSVALNGSNISAIDRISLLFVPVSKDKADVELEFFNSEENTQLSGELQLVEKWNKIINDRISAK